MQPPESASERIISNSELPIWLQQTDALRPASRELPLSPRKSAESRLSGRRLSHAAPSGRSEATALSDGRRLSSSRGELFPAVPSEPTSSEAELTPRRRAARAPPNPFEASWDSLEAFKRCTLSRLAGEGTGSSSAGTQAYDFSRGVGCGGSGGGGCLGEAATAARIARRASREAPACFSVPEDAAMHARGSTPLTHGAAMSGASWASDSGPRAVGGAVGGAVGAGPLGVLACLPTGRVLQLDLLSTWLELGLGLGF